MEVIWKAGPYEEDNLFTGVLWNYYFPPPYFCWDLLCNDEPIMDNPDLHDYNLGQACVVLMYYVQTCSMKTDFLPIYEAKC